MLLESIDRSDVFKLAVCRWRTSADECCHKRLINFSGELSAGGGNDCGGGVLCWPGVCKGLVLNDILEGYQSPWDCNSQMQYDCPLQVMGLEKKPSSFNVLRPYTKIHLYLI